MANESNKITQAMTEYKIALKYIEQKNIKQAKLHLVRALRILDDLYNASKGLERAKVIFLYKKIASVLSKL